MNRINTVITMAILALGIILRVFACKSPTEPKPEPVPRLICPGHFELFESAPRAIVGDGTQFVFYHSINPQTIDSLVYQATLLETWIDKEGFPEEQFVCGEEFEPRTCATARANRNHEKYEQETKAGKAYDALICEL